jgi:hypothetical protein
LPGIKQNLPGDDRGKKFPQFLSGYRRVETGGPDMRKASAIFFGSIAALAMLTAPVAAASSGGQKSEEASGSSPCRAYIQSADGSWTPAPCQEIGAGAHSQHGSPGKNGDDASR